MRINASDTYRWREINQKIKDKLQCESQVFVYPNTSTAILDLLLNLHLRFQQKRRVIVQGGWGDHCVHSEVELSRLGVRFRSEWEKSPQEDEKNTLAYIHDLDDAVTGQLYDHIETLKALTQTKIIRFHLAHHLFHLNPQVVQKVSEQDVIVVGLNENFTLVFANEKTQALPLATEAWCAQSIQWEDIERGLNAKPKLARDKIITFEEHLPEGFTPHFSKTENRIYDRSVIRLTGDMDAEALLQILAKKLGEPVLACGQTQNLETTSLSRWNRSLNRLDGSEKSSEELQKLLLISAELVESKNLFEALVEAHQELSLLSSLKV